MSLELRYVESKLEGEIDTVKTAEGSIGMPMVTKREVAITLRIPNGTSVALAVPGAEPILLAVKATGIKPMDTGR